MSTSFAKCLVVCLCAGCNARPCCRLMSGWPDEHCTQAAGINSMVGFNSIERNGIVFFVFNISYNNYSHRLAKCALNDNLLSEPPMNNRTKHVKQQSPLSIHKTCFTSQPASNPNRNAFTYCLTFAQRRPLYRCCQWTARRR